MASINDPSKWGAELEGSLAQVRRTLGECNRGGKLKFQRNKWVPADGEETLQVIDIRFQEGPLTHVGANGCQLEDVIDVCVERLQGFQRGPFACRENELAIQKLEEARLWLSLRNWKRQAQGVEGTMRPHAD